MNISDHRRDTPFGIGDAIVAVALFGFTVVYWTSLPHSLQAADESVHLYEAKRLLNGEVLYRDFFNFITPGWFYLIATLFWLFGTTIETARTSMAVMHGLTVVLIYGTCRRLQIRQALACLPVLAYLALFQSAWPLVSQHWVSTLLCAATLWAWSAQRGTRRASLVALALGLGALISVQQQRGVFMAVATAAWLVADAGLRRWYAPISPGSAELKRVVRLTLGTAAVVGVALGVAVLNTGFSAVWQALVIFPLFNYRTQMSCPWGDVNLFSAWYAQFTAPLLLKYLPVVLGLSLARLLWLAARRRDLEIAQGLLVLLLFGAASAASIMYFPDFIKISFIAFAFCIAAAEHLEWLARKLPRSLAHAVVGLLIIAAAAGGGWRLYANADVLRRAYPFSHDTAFGRIDYGKAEEARLRDELDTLLSTEPSREFYAYPILADLYLTVPADNPTPYGFFFAAGYHTPEQVQHVIDVLRAHRLPYIVALPAFEKGNDPVLKFIMAEYEPISQPYAGRVIYKRRAM